jgi:hypothetical protein
MLLLLRHAQVVEEGYEFFAKRQLVTIFSAPNYCGEFENAGAMMSVDETLMCSFQVRLLDLDGETNSMGSSHAAGGLSRWGRHYMAPAVCRCRSVFWFTTSFEGS